MLEMSFQPELYPSSSLFTTLWPLNMRRNIIAEQKKLPSFIHHFCKASAMISENP